MKNLFFVAIVAILFSFFAVSCTPTTSTGPGISKTVIGHTTIPVQIPKLEPRKDCNGYFLPDPKFTGFDQQEQSVSMSVPCEYTDEEIRQKGYAYVGSNNTVPVAAVSSSVSDPWWSGFWNSGFMNFMKWLIALILLFGLLALLAYLISEIINAIRRRNTATTPTAVVTSVSGNPPCCGPCGTDRVCIPINGTYLPPVNPTTGRKVTIMENAAPSKDVLDVLKEKGGSMTNAHGEGYHLEVDGPIPPAPVVPSDIYVVKETGGGDASSTTINIYPYDPKQTAPPADEKKEDASKKA